ncbi:hypothetical protein H5T56_05930 [Candidatus Bipolaricaulota bacterium]|nr:hypothetical protein [Candidatus Bipolaricaulota bacterium]
MTRAFLAHFGHNQAPVEKRWNVIRKLIGYARYDTEEARKLVEAIYADWELVVNLFQPVRKLFHKERVGSKVRKICDRAQTPFQRVLAALLVGEEVKERLWEMYRGLGPLALRRRVEENL